MKFARLSTSSSSFFSNRARFSLMLFAIPFLDPCEFATFSKSQNKHKFVSLYCLKIAEEKCRLSQALLYSPTNRT